MIRKSVWRRGCYASSAAHVVSSTCLLCISLFFLVLLISFSIPFCSYSVSLADTICYLLICHSCFLLTGHQFCLECHMPWLVSANVVILFSLPVTDLGVGMQQRKCNRRSSRGSKEMSSSHLKEAHATKRNLFSFQVWTVSSEDIILDFLQLSRCMGEGQRNGRDVESELWHC